MKKNTKVQFSNKRGDKKPSEGLTVSDEDNGFILVAVTHIEEDPTEGYPAVHYFPVSALKKVA